MKKILLSLLILLFSSSQAYALSAAVQAAVSVSTSSSSGTWLKKPDTLTDELSNNSTTFVLATNITVPGSGTVNISKIAFKARAIGSATTANIKLTENTNSGADIYASGNCTPVNNTWCEVTVNYNATGGTTYRVSYATDSEITEYGDADAGIGSYTGVSGFTNYAGWVARTDPFSYDADAFAASWAVAICYGGTCSGAPE